MDLRKVKVPAMLEDTLAGSAAAMNAFDSLSKSHKREFMDWMMAAKREDIGAKRSLKVDKLLSIPRGPRPARTTNPYVVSTSRKWIKS